MKYAICVAYLSAFTVASCLAEAPDCRGLPDGTLLESPDNPRDYYKCESGVPVPVRCDGEKVFCKLVNACVKVCPGLPTTTTTTIPSTTTTPTTSTTTTTTPSTTTTTTTTPSTTTTSTTPSTTTTTTTPSTTTTTTSPSTTTTTTTTESPGITPNPTMCNGYPNGVIFPLAGTCSGFVMCENGQPQVGYCRDNSKFNPVTGICGPGQCPSIV